MIWGDVMIKFWFALVWFLLLIAAVVFLTQAKHAKACSSDNPYTVCGHEPMKPLVPLSCKDLIAECRCDEKRLNCRWEWECIPKD